MNMTLILLTVSVGCNLWFLFLLLYDRIMETKLVRFFRNLAKLWQALDATSAKQETGMETPSEDTADIIGKSRFKMTSTRTLTAIPVPQAATSEKGMELSEEDATFDDGNAETASRPVQVPEEKLDETFTSIQPSELEFGENEPEEDESDLPQASGQRKNLRSKSDKFISLLKINSATVMETNGYRLLLPEGTLDYFIISDVKESNTEIVIYLEEKNEVPGEYSKMKVESKGFYDPVVVQDFPVRGKKLFLNIRRRRWIVKEDGRYVSRNWKLVAEGSRMTHEFASFLKELY